MNIPLITQIPPEKLAGARVLVRLDLNVPIVDGAVREGFRIERSLPTLEFLKNADARTIVISHAGKDGSQSLSVVADFINRTIPVKFITTESRVEILSAVQASLPGEILVLENIRKEEGETANDPEYARFLASLGDIYINDAFSSSHRAHASIVGVTEFLPSYIGFQFAEEVKHLGGAFSPTHPFLFILGGAKSSTKLPLIKKFISLADRMFVGGVPANNFFAAAGLETGKSVLDAGNGLLMGLLGDDKITLPQDVVVQGGHGVRTVPITEVEKDETIVDAGTTAVDHLLAELKETKYILWNGPLGNYEIGFEEGTARLLRGIAEHKGATSIIGGGDTVAIASKLGILSEFSFVSTGGGAMLHFLAYGTLPGIDAVMKSVNRTLGA